MSRLQGFVFEVVVVFHVPQDEVGGERAEMGSDVGLGEIQLPGMTEAPALKPRDVLNQLEKKRMQRLRPSCSGAPGPGGREGELNCSVRTQ